MDQALAILRQPDGLTVLVTRQLMTLDLTVDALEAADVELAAANACAVRSCPLDAASEMLIPERTAILDAWRTLAWVDRCDATTLMHVLLVLAETVLPTDGPQSPLPPLPVHFHAPRPQATAAHPRAFRGTTYQPPKPKTAPTIDLRPYLCSAHGQRQVLAWLARHWQTALALLARRGYDIKPLAIGMESGAGSYDVGIALRHGVRVALGELGLPHPFLLYLLPALRGVAWDDVHRYLAAYWALELDHQPALMATVAHLTRRQPTRNTLAWCRHVAQQPLERRLAFVNLLLATGAYMVEATSVTASDLETFNALATPAHYAYRLCCLFNALRRGIAVDYLFAGFRLADQYRDSRTLHTLTASGIFPTAAVNQLLAHLSAADDWYDGFPLVVWRRCGEFDGLGDLITQADWAAFAPNVAFRFLNLHLGLAYHDLSPGQLMAKWRVVRDQATLAEQLLRDVSPAYQMKAVAHLDDYVWQWDEPADLTRYLGAARTFTRRLAQPPFRRESDVTGVLAFLLEYADAEALGELLTAPDRPFRRLETACRRRNEGQLIVRGVGALSEGSGAFAIRAFLGAPEQLFRVARTLGSLSAPLRAEVVRAFNAQLVQLEERLDASLSILEQLTIDRLGQGITVRVDQEVVRHALQLRFAADENRRAFRNFLKAYLSGQHDYVLQHPRTREWLRRHPTVGIEQWSRGFPFSAATEATGPITIEVEQDPLEALKLGTYVGSCLGLGGTLTYSAVAVILDINKRVIYARNRRGAVVARQLVAISEDNRLVCYPIYPATVEPDLEVLFHDYDRALANSMGIQLHSGATEAEYTIEHILSHNWWDDGAWDFSSAS